MTMDSKGIIKCYELKVTIQDLKSNAKKSWYGHYNYLVVSRELYNKVNNWSDYIPKHIGIIVGEGLESCRKAQKCEVTIETEIMLKESMVRSMFYKMQKYKDAQSLEKQKAYKAVIRKLEKDRDYYYSEMCKYSRIIGDYENYKSLNDGVDIDLSVCWLKQKKRNIERIGERNNERNFRQ